VTRLIVENVHRVSRRPWVLVTGRLEGDGELRIGDGVTIGVDGGEPVATVIRSIEIHSPAGLTTIALDESVADVVGAGVVVTRAG
jgi:hypothetical protein